MKQTVVYTAIFGGYDPLRPLLPHVADCETQFVCFTDDSRLSAPGWETITLPMSDPIEPPWRTAKRVKILGHERLWDFSQSVWLDGSIAILKPPQEIFQLFSQELGLFWHSRGCVYREAAACISRRKDHPDRIRRQIERYRDQGHPARWGLWMGGFLFRRHSQAILEFNQRWWDEVAGSSCRDQLSLPYVLRTSTISYRTLSTQLRGEYFCLRPHYSPQRRRRVRSKINETIRRARTESSPTQSEEMS